MGGFTASQVFKVFGFVALAWVPIGVFLTEILEATATGNYGWFFLYWGLSVLNLFLLFKTALLMTERNEENRRTWVFWGFLKIACLVGIGTSVFLKKNIPVAAVSIGLVTLIVVPLFGAVGLLWLGKVRRG